MAGILPIRLKDKDNLVSLIVNVPLDYSVSRLITELIDACDLSFLGKNGKITRKYVLQHENEILQPHKAFSQYDILRGQTLILHSVTPEKTWEPEKKDQLKDVQGFLLGEDDNDEELEESDYYRTIIPGATPIAPYKPWKEPFWTEARRLQAAGADEKATLEFVKQWYVCQQRFQSFEELNSKSKKLEENIKQKLLELVNRFIAVMSYDEFSSLLNDESVKAFTMAQNKWGLELVKRLIDNNSRMGNSAHLIDPGLYQLALKEKKAILDAAREWQAALKEQGVQGDLKLKVEILEIEIKNLLRNVINKQLEVTSYDELSQVMKAEQTIAFFNTHSIWKAELLDVFSKNSYLLAKAQRYQEALDSAALAQEIDKSFQLAETLKKLARLYLEFQSADDLESRAEKANEIFKLDQDYGNIRVDVHNLVRQSYTTSPSLSHSGPYSQQHSPPQYQFSQTPSHRSLPLITQPPRKSSFSTYWWVTLIVLIVIFCLMLVWIFVQILENKVGSSSGYILLDTGLGFL